MYRKIGVGLEVALLLIVHLRPERMPERLRCPFNKRLPEELRALETQCTQDFSFTGPVLLGWTCLLVVSNLSAAGHHARCLVASPAVRQSTRCGGEAKRGVYSPAGSGGDAMVILASRVALSTRTVTCTTPVVFAWNRARALPCRV
jgi:hypothetical protein